MTFYNASHCGLLFKELMKNSKVRKGFIAALLRKDPSLIRKTTLIPTELRKESEDDKLGILDVLIEMADGTKMNMEMQVAYFEYWINRVLYYISKVYSGQIKTGDSYDILKPCIHVSILDFIHFPHDTKCCRKIAFCDVENGKQYTNLMEIYILELKKLPGEDQNEAGIIRGCGSLVGRAERSLKIWLRKMNISRGL